MASGFYQCLCGKLAQRVSWKVGKGYLPKPCDEIRCICGKCLDVSKESSPEKAWAVYQRKMWEKLYRVDYLYTPKNPRIVVENLLDTLVTLEDRQGREHLFAAGERKLFRPNQLTLYRDSTDDYIHLSSGAWWFAVEVDGERYARGPNRWEWRKRKSG